MKPAIRFNYEVDDGYSPIYVNGAHGGVSPRGEMVIHFYMERPPLPRAITHELAPGGTIAAEIGEEPADLNQTMTRSIETGVVLSYENARTFHLWLGERLREMEAMERTRAAMAAGQSGGTGGTQH